MLVRQRTLSSADRAIGVKLGERAGDALWRSARLSERGAVVYLPGLALRPRDAPLQFSKISSRYHRTSRIVGEFSRNPNGASHKGHAEETAAAVVAATIEVDGFREFWLASGRLGSSTYANCKWRKVSHADGPGFWSWLAPAGSITERPMLESGYATGIGNCCWILSCNGPASPSIATPGKGMRGSAY